MESGKGSMVFPKATRVVYAKNPLSSVVCSLWFPAIPKISVATPDEFRSALEGVYPVYDLVQPDMPAFLTGASPEVLEVLSRIRAEIPPTYKFTSENAARSVILEDSRLSFRDTRYERRETFLEEAIRIESAFSSVYRSVLYTRAGIRYSNVIVREDLGLTGVSWKKLLKPEILGMMAAPSAISTRVREARAEVDFRLGPQSRCRMKHGFIRVDDDPREPEAYVIDFDFVNKFKKGVKSHVAFARIREFSEEAGNLFAAVISGKLHEALEPAPVEE